MTNDQIAEIKNDLDRIRRRLESDGLKAVDKMREYNEELDGIWRRLDRIMADP